MDFVVEEKKHQKKTFLESLHATILCFKVWFAVLPHVRLANVSILFFSLHFFDKL